MINISGALKIHARLPIHFIDINFPFPHIYFFPFLLLKYISLKKIVFNQFNLRDRLEYEIMLLLFAHVSSFESKLYPGGGGV